jgi:two-component system response regulator MtrA
LQGDVVLSDKLTSLEYKLLKFLLDNQGKIINKEDVISAVWQEGKTTLGVTDQALDQLIFRLRKKIEENPNAPTHIQTVKGRGFKFSN